MANFYSVSKDLEISSSSTSTYVNPGIHENVLLVDVQYSTTEKGNEFLAFYFEDANGDKLSHTEWPVTPVKPFETMSSEEKEKFLTKLDNQKRRIGQIVTTFIPREQYNFEVNSFKEYAENIVKLLQNSLKTVPVRVKVVLNNKDFTTLPNYWKYIFIEPMTIPSDKSKIRIFSSIDKLVKDRPNIVSNSVIDVVDIEDKATDNHNEIPF